MARIGKELRFDVKQLIKIDVALKTIKKRGISSIQKVLLAGANKILKQAKINVPVKTGALKKSGRILKPRKNATNTIFEYTVIFGGIISKKKFVNYALVVEEEHLTKSKYLQRAFLQFAMSLEKEAQMEVIRQLKKVRG